MSRGVNVLVVDGDPLARRALVARLEREPGVDVAGTAADAASALGAIERLAVDVVLMDACLGREDGLAVMRRIHGLRPRTAVLILSTSGDRELGLRALREHASGFLCKDFSLEGLGRIIHSLVRGEVVVSRALTTTLVERLRAYPDPGSGPQPVRGTLSTREWEVLDLICSGASTQRIADDLTLATATVRSHVKRIMRKLGVHSRAEAAAQARAILDRGT